MPHPAMSWHTLYPTVPASAWVAEAPVTWHRTIPEKLVRCLWFDQRWRPSSLRTLDGREVIVHSPGRWNLQAGPDFSKLLLPSLMEYGIAGMSKYTAMPPGGQRIVITSTHATIM